jgi:hypothetical protein
VDVPQVPMSRFEPEEYVNDRYKAMEDRLAVSMAMLSCGGASVRDSDIVLSCRSSESA